MTLCSSELNLGIGHIGKHALRGGVGGFDNRLND